MTTRARLVRMLPAAEARFVRRFGVMGESLVVASNDERLLDLAAAVFGRFPVPPEESDELRMTLLLEASPGRPRTRDDGRANVAGTAVAAGDRFHGVTYRNHGLTCLITGADHDVATIDLATGRAVAYLGESGLAQPAELRYAFIEAMGLWMLAWLRGYLTVHASGVARDGFGVILSGPAGAGKSTLAVAAARRGLTIFAEDGVFARIRGGRLELWGSPWIQRLLPESRSFFPELAALPVLRQPNGEHKLEVDLDAVYPGRAAAMARPGAIVSLARRPGGPTELVETSLPHGPEVLWSYDLDWQPAHHAVADALAALPTFELRAGDGPDAAIDLLEELLERTSAEATA